jgi:hypothetical protein
MFSAEMQDATPAPFYLSKTNFIEKKLMVAEEVFVICCNFLILLGTG